MGTPSPKHLSQKFRVLRKSNYMCNSIFQIIDFHMNKFGSIHYFWCQNIVRLSCKIWQSFPEVPFFLLNFASNIDHLWKEEAEFAKTTKRLNNTVGKSKRDPLRIRKGEAYINGVLKIDMYKFAVLSHENIFKMAVSESNVVADSWPLCTSSGVVCVLDPPIFDADTTVKNSFIERYFYFIMQVVKNVK